MSVVKVLIKYLLAIFVKLGVGITENYSLTKVKVYWNIPTFQCNPHNINFTILAEKYHIIHNENDNFRGENIGILYDPGLFPAILNEGQKVTLRNGGVPQEGNLSKHLETFEKDVNNLMLKNFSGLAVVDFESWRPIFRQNFGSLTPYKNLSEDIEKKLHPLWPENWIKKSAIKHFEEYGREFVEKTIQLARELLSNATWGYYGYPHCFNMSPSNMKKTCPKEVIMENNKQSWLFENVNNLHPSLYLPLNRLTLKDKQLMIEGRLEESQRIQKLLYEKLFLKIIPYFWYKYQDTMDFLKKDDLSNALKTISSYKIDGLIIWGSSNDVNSKEKCLSLYKYIDSVLGPMLIRYFRYF